MRRDRKSVEKKYQGKLPKEEVEFLVDLVKHHYFGFVNGLFVDDDCVILNFSLKKIEKESTYGYRNLFDNNVTITIEGDHITTLNVIELYSLRSIPDTIGELTFLEQFWCGGNKLKSLPESNTKLSNLQILWLEDNDLIKLPESIGKLTQLTHLNLKYNKLSTLPDTIGQLTQLTELRVDENPLTDPPDTIGQLKRDSKNNYSKH